MRDCHVFAVEPLAGDVVPPPFSAVPSRNYLLWGIPSGGHHSANLGAFWTRSRLDQAPLLRLRSFAAQGGTGAALKPECVSTFLGCGTNPRVIRVLNAFAGTPWHPAHGQIRAGNR